ncbi:threonine/serine exporter family protein, partial [Butyricicoccus sp.]
MTALFYESFVSFFASLCFGILFQLRGKKLIFAAIGGFISWFFYFG